MNVRTLMTVGIGVTVFTKVTVWTLVMYVALDQKSQKRTKNVLKKGNLLKKRKNILKKRKGH